MKKMQRRSKVDKDGKPIEKDGKKDKDGGSIWKFYTLVKKLKMSQAKELEVETMTATVTARPVWMTDLVTTTSRTWPLLLRPTLATRALTSGTRTLCPSG